MLTKGDVVRSLILTTVQSIDTTQTRNKSFRSSYSLYPYRKSFFSFIAPLFFIFYFLRASCIQLVHKFKKFRNFAKVLTVYTSNKQVHCPSQHEISTVSIYRKPTEKFFNRCFSVHFDKYKTIFANKGTVY